MNAGFSNLTKLKTQLLAPSLRPGIGYDDALLALGLGVAAMFEKFCSRKFARLADATFLASADRDHLYLDRPPIETITTLELNSASNTFVAITGSILNWEAASGLVYFGTPLGQANETLRVTFSGGYFWDETEDGNTPVPAGATVLPDDLQLAWFLQCRAVWETLDKTGAKITQVGSGADFVSGTLAGLDLSPQVEKMLAGYRRFQLA